MRCVRVFAGSISSWESEVQRRPYHRNCGCALHNLKDVCSITYFSHDCHDQTNISFPKKQSWNHCSISLVDSTSRCQETWGMIYTARLGAVCVCACVFFFLCFLFFSNSKHCVCYHLLLYSYICVESSVNYLFVIISVEWGNTILIVILVRIRIHSLANILHDRYVTNS